LGAGILVLTGCANKSGGTGSTGAAGAADCGTVQIAQNPWSGYYADVAVVSYLLKNELGCDVKVNDVKEEIGWQGFETGQTDVILENWGHEDLAKKYITQEGVAKDFGSQGNEGTIGWYVPQWMVDKYPDITDWHNLNKYANLFVTSESDGKGQVLDGDPSFVTNDEALVKNLNLNYKVVVGGSEASLESALKNATDKKTPLLFYFWEPQYIISTKTAPSDFPGAYPVAKVDLPPYTPGCDADPATVACDYPPYHLNKIVRADWANSGSPAVALVQNFKWTNDDQNSVAADISNGMSYDDAAKKWLDANPDVWQAWLAGTGVTPSASSS
jgi:glycine betaine/proline transport system substrate-binding protein